MRHTSFHTWFLSVVVFFGILFVGKELLIPFVLAVFIWYLINSLAAAYQRLSLGRLRLPPSLSFVLSIATIFVVLSFLVQLVSDNIADVIKLAPSYQRNVIQTADRVFNTLDIENPPSLREMIGGLNLGRTLSGFARGLTSMAGNTGIIAIYLIFLFLEQKSFRKKLVALVTEDDDRQQVEHIIRRIDDDTKLYVGIKTLTSALTGMLAYVIMRIIGLDFAEFWAIMIFVLNFIPTIGSIVATCFPAILALVQFDSLVPFIFTAGGLAGLQVAIGGILDPRLMGSKLNLSPLAIILSLALWGSIWGVAGMLLCVPIMVIAMIILSHFDSTRPIAVLLSRDGEYLAPRARKKEP